MRICKWTKEFFSLKKKCVISTCLLRLRVCEFLSISFMTLHLLITYPSTNPRSLMEGEVPRLIPFTPSITKRCHLDIPPYFTCIHLKIKIKGPDVELVSVGLTSLIHATNPLEDVGPNPHPKLFNDEVHTWWSATTPAQPNRGQGLTSPCTEVGLKGGHWGLPAIHSDRPFRHHITVERNFITQCEMFRKSTCNRGN